MQTHKREAIVVGAGDAGLMAALYASKNSADVAVVNKLQAHEGVYKITLL